MNEKERKIIVKQVLEELKNKKLISTSKDSYRSTEKILYSYKALPEALKLIEIEINNLEQEFSKLKPDNIKSNKLILNEDEGTYVYGNEALATRISELKQIAINTKSWIRIIKQSLKKIESDKYYDIIKKYYFERKIIPMIAEEMNCSDGTISNNKSRLINELKVYIFPDTFIKEL